MKEREKELRWGINRRKSAQKELFLQSHQGAKSIEGSFLLLLGLSFFRGPLLNQSYQRKDLVYEYVRVWKMCILPRWQSWVRTWWPVWPFPPPSQLAVDALERETAKSAPRSPKVVWRFPTGIKIYIRIKENSFFFSLLNSLLYCITNNESGMNERRMKLRRIHIFPHLVSDLCKQ